MSTQVDDHNVAVFLGKDKEIERAIAIRMTTNETSTNRSIRKLKGDLDFQDWQFEAQGKLTDTVDRQS